MVYLLHVPSALAAVFLYALARHLGREMVVAGLRISWLPLVPSEQINGLAFVG
jgi:hypothetical protein